MRLPMKMRRRFLVIEVDSESNTWTGGRGTSVLELHRLLIMLCSNPLELVQYFQEEKVHISLRLQLLKGGQVSLANAFFTRIGRLLSLVALLANIVVHRRTSTHRSVDLSTHQNDGSSSCKEGSDLFLHRCWVTNNLSLIAIYRPKRQQPLSLTNPLFGRFAM
jgi:hypothetical protein